MQNYGYPDYEADVELYPPLRSPWTSEKLQESSKDSKDSSNKSGRKEDGSSWEDDAPGIQVPRPAHLSPRKPSSDALREQNAAERLMCTQIPSSRKDGSWVSDALHRFAMLCTESTIGLRCFVCKRRPRWIMTCLDFEGFLAVEHKSWL